jgi:ribosomal protein L11 methyltransferase
VAWQQLTLRITATELPEAEALLRLAGATAVAISDAADAPILEPAPGTTPLWPHLEIQALFDAALDLGGIAAVLGRLNEGSARLRLVTDDELARAAQQIIRPVEIGPRLTIVAAEDLAAADNRALALHMGLAFGTGQHPTTRLCLERLEREPPQGQSVLDYGCGTGVLALAALKLGASHATAIDNEPQALDATRRNAELNQLAASIRIGSPESLAAGHFDLILANILAQPLIALAPLLAGWQLPGGQIALSGILAAQFDEVAGHYAPWYEALARHELDGWGLLTGTRRSEYDH